MTEAARSCRLCADCGTPGVDACRQRLGGVSASLAVHRLFKFWITPQDKISKHICMDCLRLLEGYYEFSGRVRTAQKMLKKMLKDNSTPASQRTRPNKSQEPVPNQDSIHILEDSTSKDSIKEEITLDRSDALPSDFVETSSCFNKIKHELIEKTIECEPSVDTKDVKHNGYKVKTRKSLRICDWKVNTIEDHGKLDTVPKEIYRDGKILIHGRELDRLIKNFYCLECLTCQSKPMFQTYRDLFEHYRSEHGTRGYVLCCNNKLNERKRIIAHMIHHLQPTAFQCKICKKSTSSPSTLNTHMKVHLPDSEKLHQCQQCSKRYCSPYKLSLHMSSHVPREKKVYRCKCGESLATAEALHAHMLSLHVDWMFLCNVCGKKFISRGGMQAHAVVHDPLSQHAVQCQACGLVCKNKGTLSIHEKLHGTARVNCSLCPYQTPYRKVLTQHMRTKHSDARPFQCTACPKSFKVKSQLQRHAVQHTGERKYACPYCPRTFAHNGNSFTHRKRMHPELYTSRKGKQPHHIMNKLHSDTMATLTTVPNMEAMPS